MDLEEKLNIYCIAAELGDLLHDMNVEQARLVLHLPPDATREEAVHIYKQLANRYHPDKPNGSELKFKLITKAISVLLENKLREMNPEKKEEPKTNTAPVNPTHKKPERGHVWGDWYEKYK